MLFLNPSIFKKYCAKVRCICKTAFLDWQQDAIKKKLFESLKDYVGSIKFVGSKLFLRWDFSHPAELRQK
jgi:hypothetical protein